MHLNNLKPAWKQMKIMNAIPQIESDEILSIIEQAGSSYNIKSQQLFFHVLMLIFITFACQGG